MKLRRSGSGRPLGVPEEDGHCPQLFGVGFCSHGAAVGQGDQALGRATAFGRARGRPLHRAAAGHHSGGARRGRALRGGALRPDGAAVAEQGGRGVAAGGDDVHPAHQEAHEGFQQAGGWWSNLLARLPLYSG